MEVLFLVLFFLTTIIFFILGKDDFGRKEIKSNLGQQEVAKDDITENSKEEVKKEVVNTPLKEEPKEDIKKEVVNTPLKEEPKEDIKKEVE